MEITPAKHELAMTLIVSKEEVRIIGLALARRLQPRDFDQANTLNKQLLEQREKMLKQELNLVRTAKGHSETDQQTKDTNE